MKAQQKQNKVSESVGEHQNGKIVDKVD